VKTYIQLVQVLIEIIIINSSSQAQLPKYTERETLEMFVNSLF